MNDTPYYPGSRTPGPDPREYYSQAYAPMPASGWTSYRTPTSYPSRVDTARPAMTAARRRAALRPEEPDPYQLKKWDPKEVGVFYPDMPASYGPGNPTVYRGGRYFREVTGFARNIRDYTRRHPASPVYSKLETLLLGDAYEWFTQTLSDEVRDDFFHTPDGVE
ncbi:hypothetical protein KEM54_004956, partial [Ascosphaera aggregata]